MLADRRKAFVALALLGGILADVTGAVACEVPVFRYALERWAPDPYHVVVFHRGKLTGLAEQVVGFLRQSSAGSGGSANLTVRTADVDGQLNGPMLALWRAETSRDLPRMVVAYPGRLAAKGRLWSQSLSMPAAKAVVESPVRKELARRLLDGQTAVWILVESGRADKDDAAAGRLKEHLAKMPAKLTPAPVAPASAPTAAATSEAPSESDEMALKIAFSVLRLARTEPTEQMLLAMLVRSEDDLEEAYASEPMAFPVFGRGRVLYALVGKGITGENILSACRFLTGPCACEIKALNPGLDLLIGAAWEESVGASLIEDVELPPLTGLPTQLESQGRNEPGDNRSRSDGSGELVGRSGPPANAGRFSGLAGIIVLTLAGIVLAALILVLVLRKKPDVG